MIYNNNSLYKYSDHSIDFLFLREFSSIKNKHLEYCKLNSLS